MSGSIKIKILTKNSFMYKQIKYDKARNFFDSKKKKISLDLTSLFFPSHISIAVSLYNSGKEINPLICIHSCLQSATTITIFSISWVVCRANSFISASHTTDASLLFLTFLCMRKILVLSVFPLYLNLACSYKEKKKE